jgi:hypothetical protein
MHWESGTWNDVAGALYMASGSTGLWTAISVVCCVIALVVGSRHELDAYKKMKQGGSVDEGPL